MITSLENDANVKPSCKPEVLELMKIMKNMIIRTIVNAIWVFTVWGILAFNHMFTHKIGWLWVIVYAISMLVFRPMKPFFSSLKTVDVHINSDIQIKNKRSALALLSVKVIILLGMIGVVSTGVILSSKLLIFYFGGEDKLMSIHKVLVTVTLLFNGFQFGVNLAVFPLPKDFAKKEIIIRYFEIAIMIIGVVILIAYKSSVLYRHFLLLTVILGTIAAGYLFFKQISSIRK